MTELEIPIEQVPAEALAAFDAPAQEVEVDPVDALEANELFELSKNKLFSPIEYAQQNPDKATNPDVVKKLSDTHARIRERGFTFSDLPSAGQAVKSVGGMVAGLGKQLWNYANAFAVPFIDVAASVTGQSGPGFSEALAQEGERRMIENLAGTEAAVTGLSQLPGKALGKITHRVGTISGLGKPYDQQTDAEKSKAFFDDLGKATTAGEITQGKGGLTGAISGETQKELEAAGKPIRAEEIESLAAGDPLSFLVFGKAFGAAGGAVGKAIPKNIAPLIEKAGIAAEKAASTVGGRAIQTAGKLAEWGGVATKGVGKTLPITGAVQGAVMAGPAGIIPGIAAGRVASGTVQKVGRAIDVAGEGVTAFGKQAATGAATTPYSQLARDIFQSAPIMASETLKGAAFDVGLAAATSESPQETEAAAAFGTVLGGLKGVGRGALKVAQGQIITPRAWGTEKATPAYRSFSDLDALHAQAQQTATPGQVQRANAIREFLGDKVEAYLVPDAAAMEKAVTDIAVRQGETPASAQALAKSAAAAKGMFTGEFKDDAGNARRVVLLNDADAAPHEAFHGLQDVLGEQANTVVDGLVFQEYAPQWESLGQQYAKRLGGTGEWRDIILDKTGWGSKAAAEKTLRDAANKLEAETGATPTPEAARALAETVLTEARRNKAGWREILTPEEAAAEGNRYLARELAAENFDIAFKNLGTGLTEGNSLPEKLARIVARTAAFMGAEPLAGARTETLKIEPRRAVVEAVTTQGRSTIETPAERDFRLSETARRATQESEAAKAAKTRATEAAKAAKTQAQQEANAVRLQIAAAQQELIRVRTEAATAKTQAQRDASAAKLKTAERQQELLQARAEKLRTQQELIQARTAKLASKPEVAKWAAAPETPATGASEAAKVTDWLKTATVAEPRAAAAQTLAQAISNQQGVRLTYFGAKGELGGDPAALRPERRAQIEAQRDATNADRPLVTKDYFPYGAIVTSKGPQFKGWSPNNFNANVTRLADWVAAHPEAAKSVPLAHDLTTEAGKRGLQADLQTFVQNQQAGFTGSGLELVVPESATGATQPVKTGVKPVALPQERADAISYLFNLKLPETPRITKGKLPLNIVGQRVSEATLPGRVVEPARPRGEFAGEKAEALGIAGERIMENNPFRQAVEQAAKDAGVKPPELIEAAQILALDRIAHAETATELAPFGGNVLTLSAGFLPSEQPTIAAAGMEIIQMTPESFFENSSKWPGGFSKEAMKIGLSAKSPEDVSLLQDFQKNVMEKASASMKASDYDAVAAYSNMSALFREALEVATGSGGAADALRRNIGDSYVPPVPAKLDKP